MIVTLKERTAAEAREISGGPNKPVDKPERRVERALRDVWARQLKAVGAAVREGLSAAQATKQLTADAWAKEVVALVEPTLWPEFVRGGRDGLAKINGAIRRRDAAALAREEKAFRFRTISVNLPAPATIVSRLPEWVEDPTVVEAVRKETFAFAQAINQTTADRLRDELAEAMDLGEAPAQMLWRIQDLADEWEEKGRAEMIARTETARAYSAGNREAWKQTGEVDRMAWDAAGDACPFCLELHGSAVELDGAWFDQGDEQTADVGEERLALAHDYSAVKGPPLHPNCRCALVPVLKGEAWPEKSYGRRARLFSAAVENKLEGNSNGDNDSE